MEAAVVLQIEAKQKILGWSLTFRAKSIEKHPGLENFFELTTSIVHLANIFTKDSLASIQKT